MSRGIHYCQPLDLGRNYRLAALGPGREVTGSWLGGFFSEWSVPWARSCPAWGGVLVLSKAGGSQ